MVLRILLLIHYLACLWIWVGSEAFIDYEEDRLPWQVVNDDFIGYSKYQIYVYSVYWVCTVVTTVGYGDYSGGTSLEYLVTIGLEFFGLVVFALLQVSVNTIVEYDISYESHCDENTSAMVNWLQSLEISGYPKPLPNNLFQEIQDNL